MRRKIIVQRFLKKIHSFHNANEKLFIIKFKNFVIHFPFNFY